MNWLLGRRSPVHLIRLIDNLIALFPKLRTYDWLNWCRDPVLFRLYGPSLTVAVPSGVVGYMHSLSCRVLQKSGDCLAREASAFASSMPCFVKQSNDDFFASVL